MVKVLMKHINGPGFDSRQRKVIFFFFLVSLNLFSFFFPNILPLGWFQFSHIASSHRTL